MIRLRPASVITVLSLLAWAATVHAECAWVLWRSHLEVRGEEIKDKRWVVLDAAPTRSDCKTRAISQIEEFVKLLKSKGIAYTVNETVVVMSDTRTAYAMSTDHLCLPDTVDPRGPKAK